MRARVKAAIAALAAVLLAATGLSISTSPVGATELTVCAVDCDHTSVAAAVAAASSGDVILVGPGTYSEPRIQIDTALSIIGAGSGLTIIDGGNALDGGSLSGQLWIQTGAGEDVTIRGLTVRNPVRGTDAAAGVYAHSTADPGPSYLLDDVSLEADGDDLTWEYGVFMRRSRAAFTFMNGSISDFVGRLAWIEHPLAETTFQDSTLDAGDHIGAGIESFTSQATETDPVPPQRVIGNRFLNNGHLRFQPDRDHNGAGGYQQVIVSGNSFSDLYNDAVWFTNHSTESAFASVEISGNTFRGLGDDSSIGVGITGPVGPVQIAGNDFSGHVSAVQLNGSIVAGWPAPYTVTMTGNRIVGNLQGLNNGTPNPQAATHNWWGCNEGPGHPDCDSTVGVGHLDLEPWVVLDLEGPPAVPYPGGAAFTASVDQDSGGGATLPLPLLGQDVAFAATAGTIDATAAIAGDGTASATLVPDAVNGPVTISATLDNETVTLDSNVVGAPLVPTTLTAETMILDALPLLRLTIGGVTARLTITETGEPLPGRPIVFHSGGTPLCVGVTNANGVATCGLSLGGILTGLLQLGFDAVYLGDLNHTPAVDHAPAVRVGGLRLF